MARDRVIGAALVVGAIVGVIIYGLLVFAYFWWQTSTETPLKGGTWISVTVLEISAFIAVLAILAILGWIGYVMATTPPPVPLEPEPVMSTPSTGTTTPSTTTAASPSSSEKPEQQK